MDVVLFLISSFLVSALLTFTIFKCSNKPSPSKEKEAAAAAKDKSKIPLEKTKSKGQTPVHSLPPPQNGGTAAFKTTATTTTSGEKADKIMMAKTPGAKTMGHEKNTTTQ
uniref:Uncharacterized protein n=1 Tax=Panagrolaimus sp. ES5 TaxID=591445 RepID=A0AC34FYA6_9BILA